MARTQDTDRPDDAGADSRRRVCPRCGWKHTARQACGMPVSAIGAASSAAAGAGEPDAARPTSAIGEDAPPLAPLPHDPIVAPSWPAAAPASAQQRGVVTLRSGAISIRTPRPAADARAFAPPPFVWPPRRRVRRSAARRVGSWAGAIIGTIVLVSCLAVAGTYVAALTQVDQDVRQAIAIGAVAIGVGIVFGMTLLYVSSRMYAKIVFAALSLFLLTAGCVMLTIAPVLRQMNTEALAEYRAFGDLLWFGALALVCGIALGLACLRWATQRVALRVLGRWARLLGSAYGVMLGISGVLTLFTLVFVARTGGTATNGDSSVTARALSSTAIAMWAFVPGLILTYQGISASMGEGSSKFHIAPAAWLVAAFGAVLGLGWLITTPDTPVAAPMPVLHVLAAALPGTALVAMASRASPMRGATVRGLTWRQVTLAAAISMTVGTTLALYVESLGSFCGVVLLLVHNGAFASVQNSHDFFRIVGNSREILSHNEQFAANLITASLLAPLIEEFGKGLGVRFLLRRDTTRSQAFVLGACAGAGFGFLEAMLYGVASVQASGPASWPAIMLVRGGSTSLHVVNTSLVGLAWWYAVNAHRPRRAWLLFGVAVLNHAAWNAFATALDSRILGLDTLSGHLLEVVSYIVIGVVAAGFVVAVPAIARYLRRSDVPPPVSAEMAAMAPWLG